MIKLFFISLLLSLIYARPIIRDPVVNTTDAPLITTTTEPLITTTTDEPSTVGELLSYSVPDLSVNDEKNEIPPPPPPSINKQIGNTKSTYYYAYDPWNSDEDACGTIPVAVVTTFNNPEPCEFTLSPCIKLPISDLGPIFTEWDSPTAVQVVCND